MYIYVGKAMKKSQNKLRKVRKMCIDAKKGAS